ncbi:MAG TPA: hypothetical protein VG894_13415 [Bauldia sp.]|nr:hypothetical protein [Bauldia sp.]
MLRISALAGAMLGACVLPAFAAGPADVSLPTDPAALDHACMAVLWTELSDVSEGDDPQYTPPQINDAIKPWTDDAAARENMSAEDEGSSQATMTAMENLTGDVDLYLKQVDYCLKNPPSPQ